MHVEFRPVCLRILEQQLVDFLGKHTLVLSVETSLDTRRLRIRQLTDIVFVKFVVDNEVCSSVPHLRLAAATS